MNKLIIILILLLNYSSSSGQDKKNDLYEPSNTTSFRAVAELGFLAVLNHKIQFSNNGTYFNYKEEGGQDVLFPINRLSI